MRYLKPNGTDLTVPVIAQGCMRIAEMTDAEVEALVKTDLENGIDFFDHADIYGRGACEARFGALLRREPSLRGRITVQTKCGIVPGEGYDFSCGHILGSVDGSLKRLNTERIDVLLLHRPDALCQPEEVAEALEALHAAGKVRYFGVSNFNPLQIALLKKYCRLPIVFNQLQFSPVHTGLVDCGIHVNTSEEASAVRDGMILDYCRLNDIVIQPWSPFRADSGTYIGNPAFQALNDALQAVAGRYGITVSAAAIAWILRHPAGMQPIIGTTNGARVSQIAKAADVTITRGEWYAIYRAAGNSVP